MARNEIWVGLGIAALLGGAFTGVFFAGLQAGKRSGVIATTTKPGTEELPAPASPRTPPATVDGELVSTTVDELLDYFDKNDVAATDWIKGKRIEIISDVAAVSGNAFGGDRSAVVFVSNSKKILPPHVEFWFDAKFRAKVAKLQQGDVVTCVGTFKERNFSGDIKLDGIDLR